MVWEHNQNEARKRNYSQWVLRTEYSTSTLCMSQLFFSFSYFTDKESGRIITNTRPEIDHKIQIRSTEYYCYIRRSNPEYPTYATRTRIPTAWIYYYIILFTTLTADLLGCWQAHALTQINRLILGTSWYVPTYHIRTGQGTDLIDCTEYKSQSTEYDTSFVCQYSVLHTAFRRPG